MKRGIERLPTASGLHPVGHKPIKRFGAGYGRAPASDSFLVTARAWMSVAPPSRGGAPRLGSPNQSPGSERR